MAVRKQDTFALNVGALARIEATIVVPTTYRGQPNKVQEVQQGDAFWVDFVYTVGKPAMVAAFGVEWSGPGSNLNLASGAPQNVSVLPTAPQQRWDADYNSYTPDVPVGPTQVLRGNVAGDIPSGLPTGTYTGYIYSFQPAGNPTS